MQRGFAPIFVLIGIIILATVAGGTYYFRTQKGSPIPSPSPQIVATSIPKLPTLQNTLSVKLSIRSEPNKIIFIAKTSGNVYMPKSYYFNPIGPWEIHHYANNKWVRIVPSRSCNTPCDTICETGPIACAAGGPDSTCQSASSEEIFEWEKQYIDYKNKICGTIPHECTYHKEAEPGKYKVIFTYKTACIEGQLYGDNPSVIEKEFIIQ